MYSWSAGNEDAGRLQKVYTPQPLLLSSGQATLRFSHFFRKALYWRTMPKNKPKFRRAPSRARTRQEVEIKLRVPDASALRLCLKRLRARQILPRTHESNTLYDTPSRILTRRGQLMRIRIEQPSANTRNVRTAPTSSDILTYKGPSNSFRGSQTTFGKRNDKTRFKIRDEVEVVVSDGEQMSAILHALGLRPTFRYEKFRTTYALPGIRGLKVEFDETPHRPFPRTGRQCRRNRSCG
jgi:adenylate cyclase class IV